MGKKRKNKIEKPAPSIDSSIQPVSSASTGSNSATPEQKSYYVELQTKLEESLKKFTAFLSTKPLEAASLKLSEFVENIKQLIANINACETEFYKNYYYLPDDMRSNFETLVENIKRSAKAKIEKSITAWNKNNNENHDEGFSQILNAAHKLAEENNEFQKIKNEIFHRKIIRSLEKIADKINKNTLSVISEEFKEMAMSISKQACNVEFDSVLQVLLNNLGELLPSAEDIVLSGKKNPSLRELGGVQFFDISEGLAKLNLPKKEKKLMIVGLNNPIVLTEWAHFIIGLADYLVRHLEILRQRGLMNKFLPDLSIAENTLFDRALTLGEMLLKLGKEAKKLLTSTTILSKENAMQIIGALHFRYKVLHTALLHFLPAENERAAPLKIKGDRLMQLLETDKIELIAFIQKNQLVLKENSDPYSFFPAIESRYSLKDAENLLKNTHFLEIKHTVISEKSYSFQPMKIKLTFSQLETLFLQFKDDLKIPKNLDDSFSLELNKYTQLDFSEATKAIEEDVEKYANETSPVLLPALRLCVFILKLHQQENLFALDGALCDSLQENLRLLGAAETKNINSFSNFLEKSKRFLGSLVDAYLEIVLFEFENRVKCGYYELNQEPNRVSKEYDAKKIKEGIRVAKAFQAFQILLESLHGKHSLQYSARMGAFIKDFVQYISKYIAIIDSHRATIEFSTAEALEKFSAELIKEIRFEENSPSLVFVSLDDLVNRYLSPSQAFKTLQVLDKQQSHIYLKILTIVNLIRPSYQGLILLRNVAERYATGLQIIFRRGYFKPQQTEFTAFQQPIITINKLLGLKLSLSLDLILQPADVQTELDIQLRELRIKLFEFENAFAIELKTLDGASGSENKSAVLKSIKKAFTDLSRDINRENFNDLQHYIFSLFHAACLCKLLTQVPSLEPFEKLGYLKKIKGELFNVLNKRAQLNVKDFLEHASLVKPYIDILFPNFLELYCNIHINDISRISEKLQEIDYALTLFHEFENLAQQSNFQLNDSKNPLKKLQQLKEETEIEIRKQKEEFSIKNKRASELFDELMAQENQREQFAFEKLQERKQKLIESLKRKNERLTKKAEVVKVTKTSSQQEGGVDESLESIIIKSMASVYQLSQVGNYSEAINKLKPLIDMKKENFKDKDVSQIYSLYYYQAMLSFHACLLSKLLEKMNEKNLIESTKTMLENFESTFSIRTEISSILKNMYDVPEEHRDLYRNIKNTIDSDYESYHACQEELFIHVESICFARQAKMQILKQTRLNKIYQRGIEALTKKGASLEHLKSPENYHKVMTEGKKVWREAQKSPSSEELSPRAKTFQTLQDEEEEIENLLTRLNVMSASLSYAPTAPVMPIEMGGATYFQPLQPIPRSMSFFPPPRMPEGGEDTSPEEYHEYDEYTESEDYEDYNAEDDEERVEYS